MDADNLVRMANRIGEFFLSMPDTEEATHEIAQHLRKFWEPRMRRELLAHVDRASAVCSSGASAVTTVSASGA